MSDKQKKIYNALRDFEMKFPIEIGKIVVADT